MAVGVNVVRMVNITWIAIAIALREVLVDAIQKREGRRRAYRIVRATAQHVRCTIESDLASSSILIDRTALLFILEFKDSYEVQDRNLTP